VRRKYLIVVPRQKPAALRRYLIVVHMPWPAAPLVVHRMAVSIYRDAQVVARCAATLPQQEKNNSTDVLWNGVKTTPV
jgi:hypothetical protein